MAEVLLEGRDNRLVMSNIRWARGVLAMGAVSFLLQGRLCRAAETTAQGVSAGVYAGSGTLSVPNNETRDDEYAVSRVGTGALGVLRFSQSDAPALGDERGFFAAFGATVEAEHAKQTICSFNFCDRPAWGTHFGGRLGVGYSWQYFELRAGVLAAHPDAGVHYAEPVVLPDVQLRVGRRQLGWFELGLGGYDPSTTLRPGVYLGGAIGSQESLMVAGHAGIHLVNGLCCGTVTTAGFRYELDASYALTRSFRVGAGAALMQSSGSDPRWVAEGLGFVAVPL